MTGADPATRRRAWRRALILFVLAAGTWAFLAAFADRRAFFDLSVYQGAVRYWVRDGGEIYDYLRPRSPYGFTYPPFAALLMAPLAYLSWHLAIGLHLAATVVSTAVVGWWLVDPVARREGLPRWFALGIALCLAAASEPVRDTALFGQVNTLLLALVALDGWVLLPRRSRWAGVGIGLATAIKLTPGIFVLYLLVTGRWRAAVTAVGTATGATVLAAVVAPDATREFWTSALWTTDRVGSLAYVSNQSLLGVLARLDPLHPSRGLWLALVAVTVAGWVWRCRAAVRAGDEAAGVALTGVVGCLVSPVTWVHHLVWLLPALVLLLDRAWTTPPGRGSRYPAGLRRPRLAVGLACYGLLCSRLVWHWEHRSPLGPAGFLGSNAYVWVSLALLVALPIRETVGESAVSDRTGLGTAPGASFRAVPGAAADAGVVGGPG